jgi:hypothetical protein
MPSDRNKPLLAELAYLAGEDEPDAPRIGALMNRLDPRPGMGRGLLLAGRLWWLDLDGDPINMEAIPLDQWPASD